MAGQEIDEGLEEMWTESTRNIESIDPGTSANFVVREKCSMSAPLTITKSKHRLCILCLLLLGNLHPLRSHNVILTLSYPSFLEILVASENWKIQTLPLARIKKIMKSEEFIMQELEKEKQQKAAEEGQAGDMDRPILKFMISGEAPVLMSKACELLIKDVSFRAWRHTERNRRRTLQRQDLHAAVGESEVYDFLIDIVPRVTTPKTSMPNHAPDATMPPPMPNGMTMANIPTSLPTGGAPMTAAPPVPMDNSMMQQMHHHQQYQQPPQQQQQPPQQQQQQPGLIHHSYADPRTQQPQYQNYMQMTAAPDMGQSSATPMADAAMAVAATHPQWANAPVPNDGSSSQN